MGRAARHRKILGILWLAFGVYGLLARLPLTTMVFSSLPDTLQDIVLDREILLQSLHGFSAFAPLAGVVGAIRAVLGIFFGVGILRNAPWARVAGVLAALLALLHFPLGTALSLYTLWVLLPEEPVY